MKRANLSVGISKSTLFLLVISFVALNVFGCYHNKMLSLKPENLTREKSITIEKGNLKVVFADNSAFGENHKAGYNGIAALFHKDQDSSVFVPFYAGFNLEHIFGGDSLNPLFEPRKFPMELYRIADDEVLLALGFPSLGANDWGVHPQIIFKKITGMSP